ncbi:MAG: peptidyl-prolyl cis-trans isomerase, partial [Thermodesulfovibrionales bacterium]|nr:peptidyl-prolyl cis-trans isomerase [Thermodesulfovibrionales bacterium]
KEICMLRIFLSFLMIFLFAVSSYAEDVIVAKVNGTTFTQKDLEAEVDRLIPQMTFHRNVPPEKRKNYYGKALDELINRELQYRDAKAKDIKIEKEKIDAQLEKFKKRFKSEKEYQAALDKEKSTEEQVRARIEKELLAQAAYTRNVTEPAKMSEPALKEYYEKNAAKFKQPESAKLRIISTTDEKKAQDILAKIKQGDDFGELAYGLSEDSYRVKSGDVGYIHKGRMLPEIDAVGFKLKVGEVSDIIKAENNWFIIKVEDKKPEQQMTFEETKAKLQKELEAERANELKKKWLDDLRAKAKIEILLKTE